MITGEQPMAEALARLMHLEGLTVDWAGTGSLGVRLAEQVDPDLVLVDARVTGPEGATVGRALRARSGVPIIVITRCEDDDSVAPVEAGADGQVAWPWSDTDAQATVRRVLDEHAEAPVVIDLREQPPSPANPSRPAHGARGIGHGPRHHRRRAARTGG